MNIDVVRTIATYLIALVIIIGGGLLLVIPTQLDSTALLPFLTGAIGTVLGYVFGERTASAAGSNAGPTYVYAQPPTTVNVSGPVAGETDTPGVTG